jgi:DNA mismatch repair protein MutS
LWKNCLGHWVKKGYLYSSKKDIVSKQSAVKSSETPLMKQYNQIKARHPDAMLLFRVGDFYETFGEDAIKASRILGIILTKRKNGAAAEMELAGFPHHSLETYLPKLVRAGQRVAICDQLEDPKMTKTIVKRGVTELVTPGLAFNDQVLDQRSNNFLCAIHLNKTEIGAAFLDISTGEFLVAQGPANYIDKLISGFRPTEMIYQKSKTSTVHELFGNDAFHFRLEEWVFGSDFANEQLNKHFGTKSLKGFGLENQDTAIIAAGAVFHYLSENQQQHLGHITSISRIAPDRYMWLDRFTVRNLELVHSPNDNAVTLSQVLDKTKTPMGGRLLKRWLVLPLKDRKPIEERHQVVAALKEEHTIHSELDARLSEIGDLERLISKVAVGKINPREVQHLRRTLQQIKPIHHLLGSISNQSLKALLDNLDACQDLIELIEKTLCAEPALQIGKGPVIKDGRDTLLDELRAISTNGKDFLEQIQERESLATGISSLKIAFNNVFGYYIEVRNTHKDKVPDSWIRKQTLVSAERYITEELKEYEQKILGAEEKILKIEQQIYQELLYAMADFIGPIQKNAQYIAQLDCLFSFAKVAHAQNYCLPTLSDGFELDIKDGRHPVIEQRLPIGDSYVANDIFLDNGSQQIMMITGPNMSGKSAILRQTALIVLMAQIGSFVPASSANIGLIDKIFTRVGASDNISSGESTFMVEMNETASILNNISERSLILLDEIGRGTSTYDGISIAWAIAEFLHENPKAKAKTLFATHYHELNEMAKRFERIHNFNVSVKELGTQVLFLRKLIAGGSAHSFGIHVAKLAGMPTQVLKRAESVLKDLEATHANVGGGTKPTKPAVAAINQDVQLSFFALNDPVLQQIHDELVSTDINALTPVEALIKLNEIKKLTGA